MYCHLCVVYKCAAVYHGLLTVIMLPFSLLGRKFYRRESDGIEQASSRQPEMHEVINS